MVKNQSNGDSLKMVSMYLNTNEKGKIINVLTAEKSNEIKDDTIEISEKVKNIIHNKSRLYRRLVNAFPNIKEKVQFKKWTLKEKLEDIKRQIKKEA